MPKTILDVPLCHEDFFNVIGFGKGMKYLAEGMAQLIQGSSRHHFYGGVIYQI